MRAWVFASRGRARAADAFADELRADGHSVARATSRWYEGELHSDADVIYHDGTSARLAYVHEEAGIRCEYVDFSGYSAGPAVDESAPAYTLEYNAPWWTIYDRAGEKVGKSTRDEDKARARLADLLGEAT